MKPVLRAKSSLYLLSYRAKTEHSKKKLLNSIDDYEDLILILEITPRMNWPMEQEKQ